MLFRIHISSWGEYTEIISGIVASAFKSTIMLFCGFFLWLAFFDGLECFLCFFSKVSAFFLHNVYI